MNLPLNIRRQEMEVNMTTERIRQLNDAFRNTFVGGRVMLTIGVRTSPSLADVLSAVKDFTAFEDEPYEEHDFGSVKVRGETYFWKIDYYDLKCQYGSPDPSNPNITTRVLTIMRADEY